MNRVVVLIGLPASGKSSWAESVTGQFPNIFTHISSDSIRAELFNTLRTDKKQNNVVFDEMRKRTRYELEHHKDVIYDATNLSYKDRRKIINDLPKGTSIEAVFFSVPYETCVELNLSRKPEKVVPENTMKKMYKRFNVPLYGEGFQAIDIILPFDRNSKSSKQVDKTTLDRFLSNDSVGRSTYVRLLEENQFMVDAVLGSERSSQQLLNSGEDVAQTMLFDMLCQMYKPISDCIDIEQNNPNHTFTIDKHCFKTWLYLIREKEKGNDLVTRELLLAGILHDVGKAFTKVFTNAQGTEKTEHAHFYGHDNVSAYMAVRLTKELNAKYGKDLNILDVGKLVQFHMKLYPYAQQEKQWKKLINDVDYNQLKLLNDADRSAK